MRAIARVCFMAVLLGVWSLAAWPTGAAAASRGREAQRRVTVVSDAVNINTASAKELSALEGVGQRLAERIVDYRKTHGPFKKPEDLRKVRGVGAALWDRNRERIVVE
jgi:competence ComEA-like helix-hairpin-helix protein